LKKYLIAIFLLFSMAAAIAQPTRKTPTKEKPPTQKELEEMMKEAQKAMDEMSPEEKKAMDSMGIKMPDMKAIQKNVSGISDAQLKKAFEDENRVVPQKDASRIQAALATTLNSGNMSAFIQSTHQFVLSKLSAESKSSGAEILDQLRQQNVSVANSAAGLWMDGKPTLALFLMGEACKADPADANNLNNYAAFLTMCGAEQLALPILNDLAKRFSQNSTLYNNIAQAWLGLGDIARAEKYADSAIRIYAAHPQANMVKCVIEESRGNIPAAIAAAKRGISEAYSTEKEYKLKKLGYKLKSEDLNWDPPLPRDPMGLDKFTWPEYPLDVEHNKFAELAWADFKERCQQKIDELKIEQKTAEQHYLEISLSRAKGVMHAAQNGQFLPLVPPYAAKAVIKLGPGVNDVNGNMSFVFAQELEPVLRAMKKAAEDADFLDEQQEVLDKKYEDKIGEGKENPLEAICADENNIRSEFLKNANGRLQSAYRQYFHYVSRRTSDLLNYYQYTLWPDQFELAKLTARISWLTQIKDQQPKFKSKSSWCVKVIPKTESMDSLQNFDDVACKYVSKMNLGVYKITSSCSNLTGEFNLKGIKINIKDNVETGKYSGTVLIGVSKGIGPKSLQAKATIGGLVEFDNTGFTDAGLVAGVGLKAGPITIAGGEVHATVNAGITTQGKFLGQK
jgi:tetratricopeptide (TPR) repeat protein